MGIIVTLPYDPVWAPLDWAKEHCPSYTTNAVNNELSNNRDYYINYYFSEQKDAVLFALRWL